MRNETHQGTAVANTTRMQFRNDERGQLKEAAVPIIITTIRESSVTTTTNLKYGIDTFSD